MPLVNCFTCGQPGHYARNCHRGPSTAARTDYYVANNRGVYSTSRNFTPTGPAPGPAVGPAIKPSFSGNKRQRETVRLRKRVNSFSESQC
ncbi:hypothetical protein HD806DRAFT_508476 [Xylariaceae sp. AK1471]|nr:hypothetical protein HD806DRAFT_508476 [Xylariaceae sp. AK1471]